MGGFKRPALSDDRHPPTPNTNLRGRPSDEMMLAVSMSCRDSCLCVWRGTHSGWCGCWVDGTLASGRQVLCLAGRLRNHTLSNGGDDALSDSNGWTDDAQFALLVGDLQLRSRRVLAGNLRPPPKGRVEGGSKRPLTRLPSIPQRQAGTTTTGHTQPRFAKRVYQSPPITTQLEKRLGGGRLGLD